MKNLLLLLGVSILSLLSLTAMSQACFTDNGSNSPYTGGNNYNGQNGGSGFTAFIATNPNGGNNGVFIGNSGNNGGSPNIGTAAWGMYANSGQTAEAIRPFASTLSVGRSLSFQMDNGGIQNGGTVGFGLQNASGQNLLEFYFVGGASNYTLNDGTNSNTATSLAFTNGGLTIKITRTGTGTYNINITRLAGGSQSFTSRSFNNPGGGQVPARVRFFNANAGGGSSNDAFFNNLSICTPTITPAINTYSAFTTNYGSASAAQNVSVSASELIADMVATAATNFEVSSDGILYGNTATFTQSGGLASGTLRIRLKANAPVSGSYNGITAVSVTSTGATQRDYITAASGNGVSSAALTITGISANNKVYDGNTIATLSGTATYVGLQNGESFSVTGTPVANFNDAAVGTGKPVTVTGYTAPNTNYSLSQPTGLSADITGLGEATADFRTKANGNFSSPGIWEYDQGGGSYVNATQAPGSGNNVSITHTVSLDQDFTIGASKNFTLGIGADFTVNPTRTLTVSGTANFAGQSVTFESDATGTASLGQVTGTLTGATNVTVERYIPNNGFRSWRLLSVPVTTTQTIRQAWQEGDANPLPKQNNVAGYGTQITGVFSTQAAATAAGFDSTSVQASMLRWNGTGWSNITSTNQAINNFGSYFLYVRGDRSLSVTGMSNSSNATTLRSRGSIFTGDQVTNIGANAFALVPNRYPSAINFTGLTRTGGVSNLFYIWDSKKVNGQSLGMYQTFSATNSFNCLISGGSYVLGQPNTTIESGQSFFVQSTTAGTITLKESAKVSGGGSLGFRPSPSALVSKLETRLYNSQEEMLDANTVVFDKVYSKAVAAEDAPKMGNPGANFAIESESKLLAVEGTTTIQEGDVIQYRMWNLAAGSYQLAFVLSNITLPTGTEAILEDSYTGTRTVVNSTAGSSVNFTIDQNPASQSANRFRVVIDKAGAVSSEGFVIAPNPVAGNTMNLVFSKQAAGKYSVRIVSAAGQAISTYRLTHAGGTASQGIALPAVMGNGTYTVEIVAPDKSRTVKTVLVNRK